MICGENLLRCHKIRLPYAIKIKGQKANFHKNAFLSQGFQPLLYISVMWEQ